ncbi:MAG: HAMP domain-containing sensor histidine kinase [Actinomycetota bacterium]
MRKRLALLSLAAASLVVIAFLLPLAILLRNQAQSRALARAERDAQSVAAALAVAGFGARGQSIDPVFAETVLAAFGNPDGLSIIFDDRNIVGTEVIWSTSIEQSQRGAAFTAKTDDGAEVLVPVLLPDPVLSPEVPGVEATVVVRAFVTDDELTQGVVLAWAMVLGLGVFLIAIALIAADMLGRSVVRPVTELSDAANRLGEGDLDVRVEPGGPDEISEVGEAFNTLAERLDSLLVSERESVADLSHRLRTPLTALRLQAEMMSDPMESAQLKADIDDLERAVNELIHAARSRSGDAGAVDTVDLGLVVSHRAGFWRILAQEQGRETSVRIEEGPHIVALSRSDLGAMIDVLIENVFAHTPAGVGYEIAVSTQPDGVQMLTIVDDGPGFADLSVMKRGRSGAGGTGLGLDIVGRTAQRTGGRIDISTSPSGGTQIDVLLGTQVASHDAVTGI